MEKGKNLPHCTYDTLTSATVQKKLLRDDNLFPTYVNDKECHVQNKTVHNNVLDSKHFTSTFEDFKNVIMVTVPQLLTEDNEVEN